MDEDVFDMAPDDIVIAELQGAFRAIAQLKRWHLKGLAPQLHSAPDGWVLVLDTEKWNSRFDERAQKETLRYVTEPCESPTAAVKAALEMIQP